MTNTYPVLFTSQLRQHLRALRKKRGLTQAQVGALIGVSQARIAEIEANPGLVSFDQLMQLLSAFEVSLSLKEMTSVPSDATQRGQESSVYQVPKQSPLMNANAIIEQMHQINESRISEPIRKLTEKKGSW